MGQTTDIIIYFNQKLVAFQRVRTFPKIARNTINKHRKPITPNDTKRGMGEGQKPKKNRIKINDEQVEKFNRMHA